MDSHSKSDSQHNILESEELDLNRFGNLAPVSESNPIEIQQDPQYQMQKVQNYESPVIKPKIQRPLPTLLNLKKNNEPRLIIDRIILQNFKSYADKQTIGPFHENFTSVVGPNGSGKSNLIESMLFIFGYNAHWMRLKRLNELIHRSSTKSGIEKASVEVRFKKIIENQNGNFEEIPGSFNLKRVVKMSGGSKYYLNDHESTQNEVKDKLKSEGIDLNNNRFLILQGEVEQISQMKQKSGDKQKPGLLEYLQDIIGSNVYITQIQNLVKEYNQIEQTKHEKGELMKLVEIQLKNMRKGKEEAIKFVKKERYIYQIQNVLHQVVIYNSKHEMGVVLEKLEKAEAEKKRIINEEKEKLKKQAERFKKLKELKNAIEKCQKSLNNQRETMNQLTIADTNLNQEISFKSEDLVKYKRKLDGLDRELTNICKESDSISDELPSNKTKAREIKNKLDELSEQLQKYDKPQIKAKLKQQQNNLKKSDHQIKSFTEKEKAAVKNFNIKFNKTENYEIHLLDLNRKVDEDSETLAKISDAASEAANIRSNLSAELSSLSEQRKTAITELQTVQANLREHLHENREMNMFNNMFEKIMQQRIPGVLGRLGDLGTTSKKYDEIITSCCSRLDNIVVRDYDAANAVLNFLKATKLGRATCIILDKIQDYAQYMKKPWNNLNNSIRLFDQIEPRMEQVRVAFYFAISDTIYCQNSQLGLEYAMKDDRNRRRVISKKPNGFIIYELNGLMNGCPARRGGFQVKAKSKMRNITGADNTKTLENQKQKLKEKVQKIQQKYRNIKKEIEGVQKDLEQIWEEKKKMEQSIRQAKTEISDIEKNMMKNSKESEDQKKRKQLEIKSIKQKIEALNHDRQRILQQISRLENEQKSQQSQKVTNMREQFKQFKAQYTQLDKQIQMQTAIILKTEDRIKDNKKARQDIEKKIKLLQNQIEKLKREREVGENKAAQVFKVIAGLESELQATRESEEKLKILEQKQEREVKESKIKIEKAKQEVEKYKFQISTFEEAIKNACIQLEKTRQTYKQLSITYDFMQEIDAIDSMNVENFKKSDELLSAADASVIMNRSLDSNLSSSSKIFPIEKLMDYSPFEDISEDKIDPFLLFPQKLTTLVVAEKQSLKKMTGNNLQIITEYRNKFMDFKQRHSEFQAVKQAQMSLRKNIEELKEKRLTTFREGFTIINSKLKQVYQLLTRGGDAQLELIDSLDPFSDGINFSVRPPKKTWKEINKLSGGEKTLSSLSLIFALHYFKPTPLYFMDEIDAALDFRNVSIVADYIKQRTKDAQFIIISLRNNMFQLANKLVGVYKTYDKTKIVQFVPSRAKKHHGNGLQKQNMDLSNRD